MKLYTRDIKYDLLRLFSNKRRFFRLNFLINATFEHLRMRRLLGGGVCYRTAFISLFTSKMRRLLEGGVYRRVAFKRGNTVTAIFSIGRFILLTGRNMNECFILFNFLKTCIKYLQMSHRTANQCVLRYSI